MKKVLTENSNLSKKVKIRLEAIESLSNEKLSILDCYSADGTLWDIVKKLTTKNLTVIRIEKRESAKGSYLQGNNLKYLKGLDLNEYDILDLDAYGFAFEQLNIILAKKYKGTIIVTFIPLYNSLKHKMLEDIGFTKIMTQRCNSLITRNPLERLKQFLAKKGIRELRGYFIGNKNYFYVSTIEQ
jgi:hypothetical protein